MLTKTVLLQPAYFASIAQYAAIVQANEVVFEHHDHFTKQTYRNRCYTFAANGILTLNVPIKKSALKISSYLAEISYAEDWQSLHLKSLQSAYKNAPFYEYYEPEILEILNKPFKTLGELHKACHTFVMETLQEQRKTSYTQIYNTSPKEVEDLRSWISSKKQPTITFPKYIQMFDDKHGFKSNLSILDLIFMEGPAAILYLENINLS